MPDMRALIIIALLAGALAPCTRAAGVELSQPAITAAVLDFGDSEAGRRAADRVAGLLAEAAAGLKIKLTLVDRDLGRAAARGAGYGGSLNLTLREARDLGAAVGCDLLILGDAQTLRRSPSDRAPFHESYATVFVVGARTGRLLLWERPSAEAPTPERAEAALRDALDARAAARYLAAAAGERAREERARGAAPLLDLAGEDAPAEGVRAPAPYRRLRPAYTEAAARAEAEAIVDALVEIDAAGRVARVEVVRWAGFGLDESVAETVRAMNFRPATRDGEPVASRVLLRYNFRRPSPEKKDGKNGQ